MAQYVGGTIDQNQKLIEPGLWEKEERQHTPALIKVYQQLTGEKITPKFRTVRGYLPTDNPYEDLYRHGLHRIATEFERDLSLYMADGSHNWFATRHFRAISN